MTQVQTQPPPTGGILADAQFHEKPFAAWCGWIMVAVWFVLLGAAIVMFVNGIIHQAGGAVAIGIVGALFSFVLIFGFFVISPNESRAMVLFGNYRGTARAVGFYWTNPFTIKRKVSLRVRTFETGAHQAPNVLSPTGSVLSEGARSRHPLKVNDLDGNPIEISAVVVWRVIDTAESLFAVDNYERYVEIQSEAALRNLASHYHYDSPEPGAVSLRGNTDLVGAKLKDELDGRLRGAGVEVLESRISSLSYASEIAAAMLQRQQASAVVAARQKIVEGAVGMVDLAMQAIAEKKLATFSPEQKAQMVGNLLMVLVSERGAQPVVSAGTT